MKRSAIIPATFVLFAFTGCSTIRQYHLAPEGNESTPTTSYVIDIGTPLVAVTEQCPTGQDCTPVGEPVPTTTIDTTPKEPGCEDGQPSGICNYPSGYVPPDTAPDTTPAEVCGGNVTGECD